MEGGYLSVNEVRQEGERRAQNAALRSTEHAISLDAGKVIEWYLVCAEILLEYKKNPANYERKSGGDINGKMMYKKAVSFEALFF